MRSQELLWIGVAFVLFPKTDRRQRQPLIIDIQMTQSRQSTYLSPALGEEHNVRLRSHLLQARAARFLGLDADLGGREALADVLDVAQVHVGDAALSGVVRYPPGTNISQPPLRRYKGARVELHTSKWNHRALPSPRSSRSAAAPNSAAVSSGSSL